MESKEIVPQSLTVTTQVISPEHVWEVLQKGQQQILLRILTLVGQELVASPPQMREADHD